MALSDNLISYWKLDEASGNAIDSHGSNTLTDNNTVGSATGKINNGRDFEAGNTEYFSIATDSDTVLGDFDFSFTAWVKGESFSGFNTIFAKSNNNWAFFIYEGTPAIFRSGQLNWSSSLSAGTWYFIAGGHLTGGTAWLSVNAATPLTDIFNGTPNTTPTEFQIGQSTVSRYFDGIIDECGFWHRDIRSDLTELYNSGNGRSYDYIINGAGGSSTNRGFRPSYLKKRKRVYLR